MTPSHPAPRMPDYERMAAAFDAVLPFVQPVAEAVVARLPELRGGTVVDIACGTGEPGLTLARRNPHVRVLGVDQAPAMIGIARGKAAREPVPNAEFGVMPAEDVAVPDGGAAAVISRFGLLAFGDPHRSAAELARILEPGGAFSIAVWHDVTLNTVPYTAFLALRGHLPGELLPPFDHPGARAVDAREQILREAGLTELRTEEFRWTYDFPGFPAVWRFVTGPAVLGPSFDALDGPVAQEVRLQLSQRLSEHRDPDGAYRIPHTCRLYTGRRVRG